MLSRITSATVIGLDVIQVDVEVDVSPGLPGVTVVGLADTAVNEAKERIRSAIRNSGLSLPRTRVTINLAPADIKKAGSQYDLAIAIGYLLESGQIKFDPSGIVFAGELSLDGSLKHTSGMLATALLAKELGFSEVIIPHSNAKEASIVSGVRVIGAKTMLEVITWEV